MNGQKEIYYIFTLFIIFTYNFIPMVTNNKYYRLENSNTYVFYSINAFQFLIQLKYIVNIEK